MQRCQDFHVLGHWDPIQMVQDTGFKNGPLFSKWLWLVSVRTDNQIDMKALLCCKIKCGFKSHAWQSFFIQVQIQINEMKCDLKFYSWQRFHLACLIALLEDMLWRYLMISGYPQYRTWMWSRNIPFFLVQSSLIIKWAEKFTFAVFIPVQLGL